MELRSDKTGPNSRSLWVRMSAGGDLVIEGQNLGPAVERYWGTREYEWVIQIRSEDVPRYLGILGGDADNDNPLGLIQARYREDERCVSKSFIDEHEIPCEFWSRSGD